MSQDNFIQGTAAELVSKGISINGKELDAVAISIMAKYGIIKVIGKEEKVQGKRGKVGNIFAIPVELVGS